MVEEVVTGSWLLNWAGVCRWLNPSFDRLGVSGALAVPGFRPRIEYGAGFSPE